MIYTNFAFSNAFIEYNYEIKSSRERKSTYFSLYLNSVIKVFTSHVAISHQRKIFPRTIHHAWKKAHANAFSSKPLRELDYRQSLGKISRFMAFFYLSFHSLSFVHITFPCVQHFFFISLPLYYFPSFLHILSPRSREHNAYKNSAPRISVRDAHFLFFSFIFFHTYTPNIVYLHDKEYNIRSIHSRM